jgi:CBS domain-containing protein
MPMRVSEVMTRDVEYIRPDATLQEAAAKMEAWEIGVLPVCADDRLVGMLTDRDITIRATAVGMDPSLALVGDIMTPGVISCFEDELVIDAALLMQENQVRRLVVLNRDMRLVGIVSLGDLAVESNEDQLTESTLEAVSNDSDRAIR